MRPVDSALAKQLGVRKGDRVATIAPNTHQHLQQFYAIPQLGAVIVPINYRLCLSADDFIYVTDVAALRCCVFMPTMDAVDGVRARMLGSAAFCRLWKAGPGWLSYESLLEGSGESCDFPSGIEEELEYVLSHQFLQRRHVSPEGRDDHASQRVDEFSWCAGAFAHDTG